ncbi:MAG: RagB/SusD family nutrient uptake outer membrane protein [Bacteroidetes bacterium]|nr:RagB/SusD family nutrient uptake outer membrane protein [Bacteroidota bacterium]MBS1607696.1 RagB/SusD family nutrient uptake outer membrane protein [Bacteroidota bacterium]
MNKYSLLLIISAVLSGVSCTKLDVKLKDPNSIAPSNNGGAPAPSSLSKVYEQLNQLVGQSNWFAMEEHTTDELMGPTRGTDWDDFGTWRKLHLHTWDGSHNQINDTWNGLNGALFQTTLLAETASGQEQAEAKFLRAYFSYLVVDLYGQLQHRPATAAIQDLPDVYTRSEATDYIISELEAIIPALPTYTHALRTQATKEAAQFLLAKMYLNKAVFKQDPASPAGPFTFAGEDMGKVITLCNSIAANPELSLTANYWDNFKWDNGTKSTENIFTRANNQGINVVWYSCMGNHYNMPPDGWNGFTTLADFYNSFENVDMRKSDSIGGFTELTGRPAGFLIGQQRGPSGKHIGNAIVDLKDRSGNPLIFTPNVSLFFSTESKGIRTNKYPLDPATMNDGGWGSTNEFVFFRLSDVRLMKAEAILRGGTDSETPLAIVNEIRAKRGATALSSVDLDGLLSERGRELYLEGWRRNDMIRFGKFNDPVDQRPDASAATKAVFPIPNIALSSNPNLKQNPGY